MPELLDRIQIDPAVRSGKPVIRGTRIAVSDVQEYLAGGMMPEEIVADFPDLTIKDIRAVLAFAAQREQPSQPEFEAGLGDYTKERDELFGHLTLEEIIEESRRFRREMGI